MTEIEKKALALLCQANERHEALQTENMRLREEIARLRGPVTYYKKGYGPSDGYAAIQETDGTFTRSDDT
jgi:hypothetical protein